MSRPARPWFRLYVEALSDRKIRRLTPSQRWLWVAVLAAARQSPEPGVLLLTNDLPVVEADLADLAALPARDITTGVEALAGARLISYDNVRGCWFVPKFCERQFESDNSATRTSRWRHKDRHNDDGTSVTVACPESESESEVVVDSSSSSSNRVWSPEFDDDDFGKACWLLAERKLDTERLAGRGPTSNVERWLRSVYQHKRREHVQLLVGSGLVHGAKFVSPDELADHLEPTPRPKPEDAASRATLARYDRHDNPCESCGGSMLLEDDSFCPTCHPQASSA